MLRVTFCLLGTLFVSIATDSRAAAPWEVWGDLHSLSHLASANRVLLRGSRCPDGCRFDRHSEGDERGLYQDGEEMVIFDEPGAGAIVRIWMTMGPGVSEPLDPTVTIRVYLDGSSVPVVDVPLPQLFDGSTPPFAFPLVENQATSSGGNYSYVPIAYRDGARVALVGAETKRIWYQVGFHRVADATGISSFTGSEDLSVLSALFAGSGADPFPLTESGSDSGSTVVSGAFELAAGAELVAHSVFDADTWTLLRVECASESRANVEIVLRFDGDERVRMPLADFFAVGQDDGVGTRSLFAGEDDQGFLYAFWPMPFRNNAELAFASLDPGAPEAVAIAWEVRESGRAPSATAARFGAELTVTDPAAGGSDIVLLELSGRGKWVGQFAEMSAVNNSSRQYLEGDEHVYLDGSLHPELHGTGVEDFYNGGFYFDTGPFNRALHGSPYHIAPAVPGAEDVTAAYRWMATDAVAFQKAIRIGLEPGPTGFMPMRMRSVSYYYYEPSPSLVEVDTFDVTNVGSQTDHDFELLATAVESPLDSFFEGTPPVAFSGSTVEYGAGSVRFTMQPPVGDTLFRLRRRFDAELPGQLGGVSIGGATAGRWPFQDANPARRWREVDLDLAFEATPDDDGSLHFEIAMEAGFNAAQYVLLSGKEPCAALPLERPKLRTGSRWLTFSTRILDEEGALAHGFPGGGDPRDRFAVVLSDDQRAVHLRLSRPLSEWRVRINAGGSRYRWRGEDPDIRSFVLNNRVQTKGLWKLRVKSRTSANAEVLADGVEPIQAQIFVDDACVLAEF